MRTLFARWIAVVALVAGASVGATALPASADSPTTSTTTSTTTTTVQAGSARNLRPMDWWL